MLHSCPACGSAIVTTDIGYACPTCGKRTPPHSQTRTTTPSGDDTIQINDQFQEYSEDRNSPHEAHRHMQSTQATIINHHASSQYRKRLRERLAQMEELELKAPNQQPRLESTASTQPTQNTVSTNTDTVPSLTETEQKLLRDALKESRAHEPIAPHPHTHHTTATERAEELLKAASTESQTSRQNKNIILISLSVVIVLGGMITAWLLSKAPVPTAQVKSSISPSATPSNLAQQQRDKQRKADLNSLSISIESYKKNAGVYPTGSNIAVLEPLTQTSPPYIVKIPNDPASKEGSIIQYGYTSDGSSFTLSCVLENKTDPDTKNGVYVVKNNTSD
ncbi:hypothetical protein IT415_00870 [bacterium]|nr:hypothetical protein [bacterium]